MTCRVVAVRLENSVLRIPWKSDDIRLRNQRKIYNIYNIDTSVYFFLGPAA